MTWFRIGSKNGSRVIKEKLKATRSSAETLYDALNAVKWTIKETSQEFMKSKVDNCHQKMR